MNKTTADDKLGESRRKLCYRGNSIDIFCVRLTKISFSLRADAIKKKKSSYLKLIEINLSYYAL